jgi:hypothetical protein
MEPISDYSEGLLTSYFSLVAEHLTSRPTHIVWQDHVYGPGKSAGPEAGEIWGGMARKSANGGATIQIRRGLGWAETYRIFMHETAHVATTYSTLPAENQRYFTRKHTYQNVEQYTQTPDEKSATQQADIWRKWARAKAQTSRIIPQLEALLEYPDDP